MTSVPKVLGQVAIPDVDEFVDLLVAQRPTIVSSLFVVNLSEYNGSF